MSHSRGNARSWEKRWSSYYTFVIRFRALRGEIRILIDKTDINMNEKNFIFISEFEKISQFVCVRIDRIHYTSYEGIR